MVIDDNGVAYSVKKKIEDDTSLDVYTKYDGFELPKDKPYVLIESMQNNNQSLSKGRETVQTIFRYQVGIFAESDAKLSEYQGELRNLFLFEVFDLYDGLGVKTNRTFEINDDFNENQIFSDDLTDITRRHRLYFTVEIPLNIHRRR